MPDRPYLFYELTNSLCSTCLRKVEAKVIIEDDHVYLHKWCPEHRFQKVLISTDPEYYKLSRQTLKPGQMPRKFNTPIKYGCPYDCGLCPDHEQHSCLTLIEVTDGDGARPRHAETRRTLNATVQARERDMLVLSHAARSATARTSASGRCSCCAARIISKLNRSGPATSRRSPS